MTQPADWLEPLVDEISAADETDRRAIFIRLLDEFGAAEAGRRWWAASGATDASPT